MADEKIEASQSLGASTPDLFEPIEIRYDEEADDGDE
jgi:hypothetical protein